MSAILILINRCKALWIKAIWGYQTDLHMPQLCSYDYSVDDISILQTGANFEIKQSVLKVPKFDTPPVFQQLIFNISA